MMLSEIANVLDGTLVGDDCSITMVSTDTRNLEHGALFVALKGKKFDGHNYLDEAIKKGAVAIVCEQPLEKASLSHILVEDSTRAYGRIAMLHRASFDGKIIGLTGSSGKTTVKGMLSAMLNTIAPTHATEGNFNNHFGVPLTLLKLNDSFRYAVIEAGASGPGEIEYLTHLIQPDVSLVNNVMAVHVEGFGSTDAIAEEKSQIYSGDSHAVVNLDEKYLPVFLEKTEGCSRTAFGFSKCDEEQMPENIQRVWFGHSVILDAFGRARFCADEYRVDASKIMTLIRTLKISLSVLGEHNCRNALAALASVSALGVDAADCIEALNQYEGERGRMQLRKSAKGLMVIDDSYNANPTAMKAAIDYLSQFPSTALVMGDMGELGPQAESMHEDIGEYAKRKGVSRILTIGPLSHSASKRFGVGAKHFNEKSEIALYIEQSFDKETVVLVKGSRSAGMEEVVGALCKGCEVHAC